jgi:hypothetical protein
MMEGAGVRDAEGVRESWELGGSSGTSVRLRVVDMVDYEWLHFW